MLNEAQISLTGYVATQPTAKIVKPGVKAVSMRVAWTPRRQDKDTGEWEMKKRPVKRITA